MSNLPYDEWTHVLSFLDVKDLATMCLVNKCLGYAADRLYLDPSVGNRAVRICAEKGYTTALRKVLQHPKVHPSSICDTYTIYLPELSYLIPNDFLDSVYIWLISPFARDYPLRVAVMNGHTDIVTLLLHDGRSDPNSLNSFCLWTACRRRDLSTTNALLADPRVHIPIDCLRSAIMFGATEIVRALLDALRSRGIQICLPSFERDKIKEEILEMLDENNSH